MGGDTWHLIHFIYSCHRGMLQGWSWIWCYGIFYASETVQSKSLYLLYYLYNLY